MVIEHEPKITALKDAISRLEKEIADGPKSKHALAKQLRKTMAQRLKGLQAELRAEEAALQEKPSPRAPKNTLVDFAYESMPHFSCSSDMLNQGAFDEKIGPYEPIESVKKNAPLGDLIVRKNWRSINDLVLTLMQKKKMMFLMHPCITKASFWNSKGDPEMQASMYNVNLGMYNMIPKLEQIVVSAVQTMYALRDKEYIEGEHGFFDNCELGRMTNKKLYMMFDGKRIIVSMTEREDGSDAAFYVLVHE